MPRRLVTFPPVSSTVRPPPVVWRADTGRALPDDVSAADMVTHDARISKRFYGFAPEFWAYLRGVPAAVLLWVTFRREDAERYSPAVFPLTLDVPVFVIAADDAGGFLLLFDDNTTISETGGAAMAHDDFDPAAELRADIKRGIYHDEDGQPLLYGYTLDIAEGILDARANAPEPRSAFAGVHYQLEESLAALGPKVIDTARDINPYSVADWMDEAKRNPAWANSPYESAAQRDASVDDEFVAHPANVPDTLEFRPHGPGYLAHADLENPWNAVVMPLHPESDPLLREAALHAACYCAVGEHQLLRAVRNGEYTPPLYDPATAGHGIHEGIEASASWAQMAVDKMLLHNYRDIETLRTTEKHFAEIAASRGVNLYDPSQEVLLYRAEAVEDLADRLEERAAGLTFIDERVQSQQPNTPTRIHDDEDEKKKHGGGDAKMSALAHNIHPGIADSPSGPVFVTTVKNSQKERITEDAPRPSRPENDERPARIETFSERLASRFARIQGRDDDGDRGAALATVERRDAEASTKRQESELSERKGETSREPDPQTFSERLAARFSRITSREERETEDGHEAKGLTPEGKTPGGFGRGD